MTSLPPPPVRSRPKNKLKTKANSFVKKAGLGLAGILVVGIGYVLAKALVASVPSGPPHQSAAPLENIAPDVSTEYAEGMIEKKLPIKAAVSGPTMASGASSPSHKSTTTPENVEHDEYLVRAAEITQRKLPLKAADGSTIIKAWAASGGSDGVRGLHYLRKFEDRDYSQLTAEDRESARKYNQGFLATNLCKNPKATDLLRRGYAYTYHVVDGNGREAYVISISSEECDAVKS